MKAGADDLAVTADLYELRERYVPAAYALHHTIIARQGLGATVTDTDGRTYLDFAGGVAVLNVGHRHPRIAAALHNQVDKLLHVGPVMFHEGYVTLAARLAELVAPGGAHQALLVNSGAEAVENAVKLARHATGRSGIIAFEGAFHGRTQLAATLNGKSMPYRLSPAPWRRMSTTRRFPPRTVRLPALGPTRSSSTPWAPSIA